MASGTMKSVATPKLVTVPVKPVPGSQAVNGPISQHKAMAMGKPIKAVQRPL